MKILNFSHEITSAQLEQIAALTNSSVTDLAVVTIKVQLDHEQPFAAQVAKLVEEAAASVDLLVGGYLVVLPGLSSAAAALIAALHGVTGHFPSFIRLKSIAGPVTTFEVAEIVNLQNVRNENRYANR